MTDDFRREEDFEKQYKKEKENYRLGLRKEKLQKNLMKRRLEQINSGEESYYIDVSKLNVPESIATKNLSLPKEFIECAESLFETEDLNNICVGIALLKKIPYHSPQDFLDSHLEKYFSNQIQKFIKVKFLINELLIQIINITYTNNIQLVNKFATIPYLFSYHSVFSQHFNDPVILVNLITLFGNLSSGGNFDAQKHFEQCKLLSAIEELARSNALTKVKNISVWFLACFTDKISMNYYFKDKKELFLQLLDIFFNNVYYEDYTENCLIGVTNISGLDDRYPIDAIIAKEQFLNHILGLNMKHYQNTNKILCNLFSCDTETTIKILDKYDIFGFIEKGLNSQSTYINSETLYTLNNICEDATQEIYYRLIETGIIQKVVELCNVFTPMIVNSTLEVIYCIIKGADIQLCKKLINMNIVTAVLNVLAKNFDSVIIGNALDVLFTMLSKDNKVLNGDSVFLNEIEGKGGRELVEKVIMNFTSGIDSTIGNKKNEVVQKGNKIFEMFFRETNE